jgi:lipid II:glycine glycyltransferase (peptidoglycan interpeptide bridge formation enzyme)
MNTSSNTAPDGGLFQSREWQTFQQSQGRKTWAIDQNIYGTEKSLSFGLGSYAYAPRFPGNSLEQKHYQGLVEYGRTQNWVFIRLEPQTEVLRQEFLTMTGLEMQVAPNDVQPREILMFDISGDTEALLKQMKSKTRYNIRLAEKQGVTVVTTREQNEIEAFLDIMESTAKRKSIHFHERSYYQSFLTHFDARSCELFVAKKDNQVLAGSLVYFYQNTAYYLHGGSGDTGRHLMAPHLLQWTQIQEAKKRGCTQYDFGGVAVATEVKKGKDWSGITRFKQGFAPNTKTTLFPGTYDVILRKRSYSLYRILHSLKSRTV